MNGFVYKKFCMIKFFKRQIGASFVIRNMTKQASACSLSYLPWYFHHHKHRWVHLLSTNSTTNFPLPRRHQRHSDKKSPCFLRMASLWRQPNHSPYEKYNGWMQSHTQYELIEEILRISAGFHSEFPAIYSWFWQVRLSNSARRDHWDITGRESLSTTVALFRRFCNKWPANVTLQVINWLFRFPVVGKLALV